MAQNLNRPNGGVGIDTTCNGLDRLPSQPDNSKSEQTTAGTLLNPGSSTQPDNSADEAVAGS